MNRPVLRPPRPERNSQGSMNTSPAKLRKKVTSKVCSPVLRCRIVALRAANSSEATTM